MHVFRNIWGIHAKLTCTKLHCAVANYAPNPYVLRKACIKFSLLLMTLTFNGREDFIQEKIKHLGILLKKTNMGGLVQIFTN